ncbi:alpha/beta hydrolase family protein [Actinopolymorpha alba]|uniref:S9 family peptidase n=1 Tax=Actinopolymorpha alba TaxID=533267 RepID=UPI0003614EF1|nr:S9 family peptidase [Actinopolymorpha alba]
MTYDAVPLIPRAVLFGNPTFASPTVSPDGTRLGFLAPDEGVLNVWVGPVDRPDDARPVTHDRGRGIRVFGFCHDDRTLFYLQDQGGDENWRLHLLDLVTGAERCVTPYDNVQVRVLGHNRWHPTRMLLGINKDTPELHDVYELDLTTGELEKVLDNPGFVGWLVDTDLTIQGAATITEDGGAVYFLTDESGEYHPWLEVPADDVNTTNPVGFSRDGDTLYLVSSLGANAARLVSVDLETGEETVLAADEAYDIGGVELEPETRKPQAVIFDKDREVWEYLDDGYRQAVEELRSSLGIDGELGINRSERTDRLWLVSVVPSDGPVRYYLYDRSTSALRFLFSHKPDLAGYVLASMEAFSFTARDGLEIHGYITFPPEAERRNLPAVLNVHGGPWARDTWGYHPEAQWLTNRGYACVQVNYRGSTGYGKAFGNAADKQWGRTMHTDLLDAIEHLAGKGVIDRDRVGIMGGSYGGYAALAGAAFTPEAFRCAVDLCGPSNLLTLLTSLPDYWKPLVAMMHAKVGDPEAEKDMLWERSPLSRVDDIQIPVLVAQGANDPRVKQAEAEQIVAALKDKGLPHEYLLFPDEGHGLARPENREIYYAAAERFLAEHLGGRTES